jgi:hypothetical protein
MDESTSKCEQQNTDQCSVSTPFSPDQPNREPTCAVGGDSEQSAKNISERPMKPKDKWMILLTAAIAIITLTGVVVAHFQLSEMKQQFRMDQRPYVVPIKVEPFYVPNQPIRINVRFANYVKTPCA